MFTSNRGIITIVVMVKLETGKKSGIENWCTIK